MLIVDLMNDLLQADPLRMDAVIDATLAKLGIAGRFDRTFLYQARADGRFVNTHEWVAPGIAPVREAMQSERVEDLPLWHPQLEAGRTVHVRDAADVPEGSAERALMDWQGVQACLLVPLMDGGRLVGVIGHDLVRTKRTLSPDETSLFGSVARALSTVLTRAAAEAALAASQARLVATLRAVPDIVLEVDRRGRLAAVHVGGTCVLWDQPPVAAGQPLEAAIPSPLAAALRAMLREVDQAGRVESRKVRLDRDGAILWFDVSAAPVGAAADGSWPATVFVLRDVTRTVMAARDMALRDEVLDSLFRLSPLALLLIDYETGTILDTNPAFCQLCRESRDALVGAPVGGVLMAGHADLLAAATGQLRQTAHYGPISGSFSRPDGQTFPIVLRGFLVVDSTGRRMVWNMVEDVTEAHRHSAALESQRREAQEARAQLTAAVDALPDGLVMFDANDRLVLVNEPYRRMFHQLADEIRPGIAYEDLVRAALAHGMHLNGLGREEDFLREFMARHRQETMVSEFHMADGRLIRATEHSTPDGGRVGLRTDVTAQRQSEQRMAHVIEGAQVGTWEWDALTGQNRINDRWMTMLGYPASDAQTCTSFEAWQALLHPADRDKMRQTLAQVYRRQIEKFEYTLRMRHAEGHWVWVQSRGRVLHRQADGSPRLMAGVHIDVTALVQAEQRLERLIHGANVGTWEMDHRTGMNRINARWAEMLGYAQGELDPMPREVFLSMIHPDDAQAMLASATTGAAKGSWQLDHQFRLRHRDGHWVWVQSRGQVIDWDAAGRPVLTMGVHIDITPAKALELALQRERDTLARLMETSVSGITAVDAAGRIIFANREAETILGRPAQAIVGQAFDWPEWEVTDLNGAAIATSDLPVAQALMTQRTVRDHRHMIRHPDGQIRVLSVNAAPLQAPGKGAAVVCAITDITEMIQSEARLRAAIDRAEAASRAKSAFLANMSHEIRTPLNGVLGMAEVLAASLTEPAHKDMMQVIAQSGRHLMDVVNDILDLAKIESGHLTLDPAPFHPSDVIAQTLAVHRPSARQKGVALLAEEGPVPASWRMGDAKRLMQILHNLVGNAVKFTDRGEIRVRLSDDPEGLRIEVADTGVGMDPDLATGVFEEFTQGDGGPARRRGGTGLGLPISRRLARMMQGDITLHAEPGHGLRATVTLPLPVTARPAADRPPPFSGQADLPPMRLLVAEDNATNRVILKAMLETLSLRFDLVSDGDEAVAAWSPGRYDLLLFDISMPRKDGIAALREIQARAAALGVDAPPAVAVTANAMTHHLQDYTAAGFAACVSKPLQLQDLVNAIAAIAAPRLH